MGLLGYVKIGFITLIVGLGLNNYRLSKKVDNLDDALARTKMNLHYYEQALSKAENNTRVLQFTVDDFKKSEDSLVQVIRSQAKELKIKEKELKTVASIETQISDTTIQELPVATNCDFCVELKPNQLTTIKIQRVDSMLTCIPEIYNRQDLFVYSKKEYRNKRKNFFDRLIHFDFKKDKINRYQILNTNDLIQVTDTRIVNISE